jgi:phosphoglycolate phosphatase-like HAD superfamily hydrolase
MIFEKYGTSASECVFVTDTLGDMLEAKKEHVGAIAVSWGFHSREVLEKGEPFRILEMPSEIVSTVADYFARGGKRT